jgi:hypothetical protein
VFSTSLSHEQKPKQGGKHRKGVQQFWPNQALQSTISKEGPEQKRQANQARQGSLPKVKLLDSCVILGASVCGVQFTELIEAGTPDVGLLRGIIDARNGPTTTER